MKFRQRNWPLRDGIYGLDLNADQSCVSVGQANGFSIYNTHPFQEQLRQAIPSGAIGIAHIMDRTNFVALVGVGNHPAYPTNKVMIWDASKAQVAMELEFKSEVLSVKLQKQRIITVLYDRVFVHSFERNPRLLAAFETGENPNGLVALGNQKKLLVFPALKDGYVQIVDLDTLSEKDHQQSNANSAIVPSHTTKIAALAISSDSSLIATASITGTLIRVFETGSGMLVHELRRGADRAEIWNICFSHDSNSLCVGSDKGTIHVFHLKKHSSDAQSFVSDNSSGFYSSVTDQAQIGISMVKQMLPRYFSSVRSDVMAKISSEIPFLVCFSADDARIVAVSADGFAYVFMQKENELTRENVYRHFNDYR